MQAMMPLPWPRRASEGLSVGPACLLQSPFPAQAFQGVKQGPNPEFSSHPRKHLLWGPRVWVHQEKHSDRHFPLASVLALDLNCFSLETEQQLLVHVRVCAFVCVCVYLKHGSRYKFLANWDRSHPFLSYRSGFGSCLLLSPAENLMELKTCRIQFCLQ